MIKSRASLKTCRHQGFNSPLAAEFLQQQRQRLGSRLEGIALLEQCPPEVRAEILSLGEGFSSRLMDDLLRAQGFASRWSDTDVLPPANDSYIDSLVDIEAAVPLLQQAISDENDILILARVLWCKFPWKTAIDGA